jgi:hypothetical protein
MVEEIKFKLPGLDFTYLDEDDRDDDGNNIVKEIPKEEQEDVIRLFKKYPYIVVWGQLLGSYGNYIYRECERAEKTNAPKTAIYYKDGEWSTFSEIKNEEVKSQMNAILTGGQGGIITNF